MNDSASPIPSRGIKAARWIFFIAAIYGIPVMLLSYLNPKLATNGQPLTQPEFYYGFVGVTLAWQVVFVLIGLDPIRYRPLMLVAAFGEKFLFVAAIIVLIATHQIAMRWAGAATIDGLLGMAFLVAYRVTHTPAEAVA